MAVLGLKMSPLAPNDCCDRCGAQAYVKAAMLNGDLLFCAHDWRVNEEAVLKVACGVQDERRRLYEGTLL